MHAIHYNTNFYKYKYKNKRKRKYKRQKYKYKVKQFYNYSAERTHFRCMPSITTSILAAIAPAANKKKFAKNSKS